MVSILEEISKERKGLQEKGDLPQWITTPSWQLIREKYVGKQESFKERYETIARTAASYMPNSYEWYFKFRDLIWSGDLAPSTPIITNMGKEKGQPVSCSGGRIGDAVSDFYLGLHEAAMLSKNGFGTSGYMGDIRPRGSRISGISGSASGIVPVFQDFVTMAKKVSQGSTRRGAWAGYVPIEHPDFYELWNDIYKHSDGVNVGWNITDSFIDALNSGDQDALERYQKTLLLKMTFGKGYYFFVDKANRLAPEWYRNQGKRIVASNLCTEIMLPSTLEETFTCIISSLNLTRWKNYGRDTIFNAFVFLYCVALDFISKGKHVPGLEKAIRFTENHMALGLGTLGFHTYLQDNRIPLDSLEAHLWNIEVFKEINKETERANIWLAEIFGEAPVTKGTGRACATKMAIAPNLSSSLICGGVSQGIGPFYKNAFYQGTPGGDVERINPSLLPIMKARGVFNPDTIKDIIAHKGSVQHVPWLDSEEKRVFKTAFEWDQTVLIRLASTRQPEIDQGQSLDLHFSSEESEEYIGEVHRLAFEDPNIKSLYYIRSESGVATNKGECIACGS